MYEVKASSTSTYTKDRMKKILILFMTTGFMISCTKTNSDLKEIKPLLSKKEKLSMEIFGNTKFEFNKNDSAYIQSSLKLSEELKSINQTRTFITATSCLPPNSDSTFTYFTDSTNTVVEGPHIIAKFGLFETTVSNCPTFLTGVEEARAYLIAEGYSDIAAFAYKGVATRYKVIHAANALIHLKAQMIVTSDARNEGTQSKLANCVLQAIGYEAVAELGANWAAASRQVILKAIGKLALRYIGWIGAAIAVVSFVDCMWGG